ncbi:hypothetical protein PENARI_c074G02000 [Penicillium arizonense]|uniref:Uncharacterized protein n=1 Tax=Penicillium arizonense TaxID=1835702 RepID=A0A1F5L1A6_PENAI|nr:hypothetical protein PENARI_c074G02000 [Penicillium arizonense]OGE47028.1 hypothetical protein PENARI_c074G02000 [Penicillium arizonense]
MSLTSNQRRALARQQCRAALAAHIHERLGLLVPPQHVRLQPSAEDGYAWSVLQGKEYLLDKNLGNGTVGRYEDIMKQIGSSFEAVTPQRQQSKPAEHMTTLSDEPESSEASSTSFTEMIQQLEHDKHVLAVELESTRAYSSQLLRKDGEWQEKTCNLEKELHESRSSVNQLETELGRVKEGMIAAMTVLRSCQHSKADSTSLESNDEKP